MRLSEVQIRNAMLLRTNLLRVPQPSALSAHDSGRFRGSVRTPAFPGAGHPGAGVGNLKQEKQRQTGSPAEDDPAGLPYFRCSHGLRAAWTETARKWSDLCVLRDLPERNRSVMFSEGPESCENPHYFRMEQLQNLPVRTRRNVPTCANWLPG